MVVAIDGPAGSGKSTIAKLIAEKLSIEFLNSGSFYRGVTYHCLKNNISLTDVDKICEYVQKLKLDYKNSHLFINDEDVEQFLRSAEVDSNVAQVSAIIPLRHIINEKLRELTSSLSFVCEGRDMTTVVFPEAEHKFYLDASLEVQAQRRFNQKLTNQTLDEIREIIKMRDAIDKAKEEGALKIAEDALYIDTSLLTIEQVCEIILHKIYV